MRRWCSSPPKRPARTASAPTIAVGGRHQAHVDRDGARPVARALGRLPVEDADERGLHDEGSLVDRLDHEGAPRGELEQAGRVARIRRAARAGAPEERGLELLRGEGGRVDGDEGATRAIAELVEQRGGEPLAGAGLPGEEHRPAGGARGGGLEGLEGLGPRGRRAHHLGRLANRG